ncbi:MAG: Nif3-like dinuclear metal center hexameric protein [Microbacteriaceae bacterium]
MTTLGDALYVIERLWPEAGAESWDAPGLVTGARDSAVTRVLFVVDVTQATVDEAIARDVDLIVAHHPLLLRGVTTVAEDRFKGSLIAQLIRANCAVVAVHTNGDSVTTGTSAVMARALGIDPENVITSNAVGGGIGIVGTCPEISLGDFARRIAEVLPATAGGVRVSGNFAQPVSRVALCAGAGDSLLGEPAVSASDVYVTSDLRHHPASEFREQAQIGRDTALIDVSHWAAEWLWLDTAATEFRAELPNIDILVSDIRTDPWDFAVIQ